MSTGARFAWFLLKWVLTPTALALIGYFFVGPRVGQAPSIASIEPTDPASTSERVRADVTAKKRSPREAPEVEVRVTETRRRAPERRRETRPAPREESRVERVLDEPVEEPAPAPEPPAEDVPPPVPNEEAPTEDEGGSGGAAGAPPAESVGAAPPDASGTGQ